MGISGLTFTFTPRKRDILLVLWDAESEIPIPPTNVSDVSIWHTGMNGHHFTLTSTCLLASPLMTDLSSIHRTSTDKSFGPEYLCP